MTMDRFPFQVECVAQTTGKVLNVGANEDPGGLRSTFADRVLNCDIRASNPDTGAEYPIDHLFDCANEVWPFPDDFAELVVLGDIIEHLWPRELWHCLSETKRVSEKVCITVPEDDRIHTEEDYWDRYEGSPKGEYHCQLVTENYIRKALDANGWDVEDFRTVDYGFVPKGYFILARRRSDGTLEDDLTADKLEVGKSV